MKVLQALYSGFGGHGSVAFSLIGGDRRCSWEHELLFYGIEPLSDVYVQRCSRYGVDPRCVMKQRGVDVTSWRRAYARFVESRPDVVLLHSGPLLPPALAYRRRVPGWNIVVVDHQAHGAKAQSDWVWLTGALAVADHTVFLTREARVSLPPLLARAARGRASVIENGIDLGVFHPGPPLGERRPLRIGMQARFVHWRDHATLIRAFASLQKRRGDLELILAGEGETRPTAEALAAELGVTDRVRVTGLVAEPELAELLRGLDVYVHSSLAETLSTAIMQCMATALPIVATAIPGVCNMLESGSTGELVPVGDVERMAATIEALLESPQRRRALGDRARDVARHRYSQERMFEAYDGLLSREASSGARARRRPSPRRARRG